MNDSFKKILLVTDGSENAKPAESYALKLAIRTGAELIIADTIRVPGSVEAWFQGHSDEIITQIEKEKTTRLEMLAESFKSNGCPKTSIRILKGKSSIELTRLVIAEQCDLLIRYRKGVESLNAGHLGRTALGLLRICPCPVLLIAEDMDVDSPNVVACVDISDAQELNVAVIDSARKAFADEKTQPGILYCWTIFGHQMLRRRMNPDSFAKLAEESRERSEQEFHQFLEELGLNADSAGVAMEFGDPEIAIPKYLQAHDVDLAVMATAAPSSIPNRLLGSTIEHLVASLPSNLLAIKPPAFESPVTIDS